MKRGQTQEIFTWIFVVIVAAAILFFGIKLLKNTNELKDDVLVVKFFSDLDKKLNQYYFLDKGSSGEEKFLLPANVKWICFVNGEVANEFEFVDQKDIQLIDDLKQYSNVFVGPMKLFEENRFKLTTKFYLTETSFCKQINGGVLTLEFLNKGVNDGVEIK